MADRTLTSGPAYSGAYIPRAFHCATVSVPFSWTAAGSTVSVSDVVQLVRIPKGAIITDLRVVGWYGSDAGATIDLGMDGPAADVSCFATAKTISATATVAITLKTGFQPYLVSLSDDAGRDFRYFQAKFVTATSGTATAIIKGTIEYVIGQPTVSNT